MLGRFMWRRSGCRRRARGGTSLSCHQWVQDQPHGVAGDQAPLGEPFGPRRHDVRLLGSSSRFARITRVNLAVPATPRTPAGSQTCT